MRATPWAAAAIVAAAVLLGAAPAQAGSVNAVHPDSSWVTVSDLHDVAVCDNDPDGHKTYARIWMWYEPDYTTSGYDTYGHDAGPASLRECRPASPTVAGGARGRAADAGGHEASGFVADASTGAEAASGDA